MILNHNEGFRNPLSGFSLRGKLAANFTLFEGEISKSPMKRVIFATGGFLPENVNGDFQPFLGLNCTSKHHLYLSQLFSAIFTLLISEFKLMQKTYLQVR